MIDDYYEERRQERRKEQRRKVSGQKQVALWRTNGHVARTEQPFGRRFDDTNDTQHPGDLTGEGGGKK